MFFHSSLWIHVLHIYIIYYDLFLSFKASFKFKYFDQSPFSNNKQNPTQQYPPKLIIGVREKLIQENPPKYEGNLNEITK